MEEVAWLMMEVGDVRTCLTEGQTRWRAFVTALTKWKRSHDDSFRWNSDSLASQGRSDVLVSRSEPSLLSRYGSQWAFGSWVFHLRRKVSHKKKLSHRLSNLHFSCFSKVHNSIQASTQPDHISSFTTITPCRPLKQALTWTLVVVPVRNTTSSPTDHALPSTRSFTSVEAVTTLRDTTMSSRRALIRWKSSLRASISIPFITTVPAGTASKNKIGEGWMFVYILRWRIRLRRSSLYLSWVPLSGPLPFGTIIFCVARNDTHACMIT